jgi:hypothetical protein
MVNGEWSMSNEQWAIDNIQSYILNIQSYINYEAGSYDFTFYNLLFICHITKQGAPG